MNSLVLIGLAAVASVATAADDRNVSSTTSTATSTTPTVAVPVLRSVAPVLPSVAPVLRSYEPVDSGVFRLPAPAASVVAPSVVAPTVPAPIPQKVQPIPVATASPIPGKLVLASAPPLPVFTKPVDSLVKPALPADVLQEVAFYCQKNVGHWREADARKILGAPLRSRVAYDENKAANGRIYAFHDPTGRYRELELDFETKTGALRTVFVYPLNLSWQQAHRRWAGEVNAADAQQGRKFYSYGNRRMDVLVDAQGRVISLGLY